MNFSGYHFRPKILFTGFRILLVIAVIAGIGGFPFASVQAAGTHYVATTGYDSGDCNSPTAPCKNIQYAVNHANWGDTILVATGTYTYIPSSCSNWFVTPVVLCVMDNSLTILGGFSGSNWSARNTSLYPTIIDGQNTNRGVAVFSSNDNAFLDLEGFTIQNCRAFGPTYSNPYNPGGLGGGMMVVHAWVTVRDVIFNDNQAIGANTSSGAGGIGEGSAIHIEATPAGTTSLLQRVTVTNNKSYGGSGPIRGGVAFGALFIFKSNVIVEDSVFTNNLAQAGSSGGNGFADNLNADALGGGIAIQNCPGCANNVTLTRVTISGNQVIGGNAGVNGGGAFGGAVIAEDTPVFSIYDSTIANNTATAGNGSTAGFAAGGGIQSQNNSEVNIQRTTILGNSATGGSSTSGGTAGGAGGGGMYLFTTHATGTYQANLTNVIIVENSVQQGPGVTALGNGMGGGLVVQGVHADITHATFARNRLNSDLILGQALAVTPYGSVPAVVNLDYSIIAEHTVGGSGTIPAAAVLVTQNGSLTFSHGLFAGNTKDTNYDSWPVAAGTYNGLDTMQTVTSAGFVSPDAPNHNYHILSSSAAKDKATNSTTTVDIDNDPRPYGTASDFGADEYIMPSLSASPNIITVVTDKDDIVTRHSNISVQPTMPATWTATTSANWVYLGPSGTSNSTTGQADTALTVRVDPSKGGLGAHSATITITAASANSTAITVQLFKYSYLYETFVPILLKP
jgi:hypothetical protein